MAKGDKSRYKHLKVKAIYFVRKNGHFRGSRQKTRAEMCVGCLYLTFGSLTVNVVPFPTSECFTKIFPR